MKRIKIRLDMPEVLKEEIICLVKAMNEKSEERIKYWKKCVAHDIDEALKLELLSSTEAKELREYYYIKALNNQEER